MNGIYISFENPHIHYFGPSEEHNQERIFAIPQGKGAFEYLFAPIFQTLQPLYWYTSGWESGPFMELHCVPGGEEIWERLHLDVPSATRENGMSIGVALYKAGILPQCAHYLRDDWITLVGLVASTDTEALQITEQFVEIAWRHVWSKAENIEFYELVEHISPCCFFCIDGSSWEFYAKDKQLVEQVYSKIQGHPGLHIKHGIILRQRESELGFN